MTVVFSICCSIVYAQAKSGLENYNLVSNDHAYTWMPVAHYQSQKGLYTELRYNYEDVNTISLYGGKTFFIDKKAKIVFTPMIGWSIGIFNGPSVAGKSEAELNNFFVSTEVQYSMDMKQTGSDFMFSWSEAGFNLSKNFFAGASVQTTFQKGSKNIEPGLFAGFESGRLCVPVYLFKPFTAKSFFIVGVNYQLSFSRNKK